MMNIKFLQYKREWKKISVITVAMLLSACGGSGGGDSSAVAVNVSSPTDNVIHADINQTNQKDFTVNVGDQSISAVGQSNAYQVSVTQSNPNAGFAVNLGTCAQAISNGQSCQFNLSYAPTTDAQYNQEDTLTISVGGTTQTITIKGDKGQDFVVFGDSLSDAGIQDQLAALVNFMHGFLASIPAWPTVAGTSTDKSPTYTTPGGNVWVTDLAKLVGESPASALPNNSHYMHPIKVADPQWYDALNMFLQMEGLTLDTETGKLVGSDYAQGGASTTCAGIGVILDQKIFQVLPKSMQPSGSVPLYVPSPIGPIPQINGQPAYSCPKVADAGLQAVYDQLENYNQIDSYLQTMHFNGATGKYQADPDKIYILWGGANNLFLEAAKQPTPSAAEVAQVMTQAAGDIAYDVQYLAAHGAKKFMVLFLPNIGLTPSAIAAKQQSALEKASVAYNTALNNLLGILQKQDPNIKIVPVDVFNIMNDIVANYGTSVSGKTYQFDDVTTPACIQTSETGNPLAEVTNSALFCTPQADNKKHIFEDSVHPTAETHQVFASIMAKAMEAFD